MARTAHPPASRRRRLVVALAAFVLALVPATALADPPPSDPSVSGGSLSWQAAASVTVSASGSTAAPGHTVVGYEYRLSTDGGSSWGAVTAGPSVAVSAEGETLVQFRAVDDVLATSDWAPSSATAASTVRIDRTGPSGTVVSGGSLTWQRFDGMPVGASAATDALSGVAGYERRSSTDGGASWGSVTAGASLTVTAEGQTLVQFRPYDAVGNRGAWAPAHSGSPDAAGTVRLDRSDPTAPSVAGGALAWQSVASVPFTPSGATDAVSSVASHQYRFSTNGGVSWGITSTGPVAAVTDEGETMVQFRAVDAAGNASAWAPAAPGADSTARIDRTAPSGMGVNGGASDWQSVASVTVNAAGASDHSSGLAGYERRTSTDGGGSWSSSSAGASQLVTAEGETLVQFRAVDVAGNASAWTPSSPTNGSTARIDRTAPSAPSGAGGSLTWSTAADVTISASGAVDTGGSGITTYHQRTSDNGGLSWTAVTLGSSVQIGSEGETAVQFRATDAAGNQSAWGPAPGTAGATSRLDRVGPTGTAVTGGSSTWQSVATVTVNAGSAADASSGLAGYERRVSTDGGASWGSAASAASAAVTAEGETLVQFRAVDAVGNASAWAPASPTDGSTARIDRGAPSAPSVAGGSASWQSSATVPITGSGATDAVSGVGGYRYRVSTDGGSTWGDPVNGATASMELEGERVVQFQSLDQAGNASAWAPASPTAGSTARIDRTGPTGTTLSGGSSSWQDVASVTVTAAGASDGAAGLAGYEHRVSTDSGSTWGTPVSGAAAVVSAEGETLVQGRAVDAAGNVSAWAPAFAQSGSTVRIDRTDPVAPAVGGGSSAWQNEPWVTVTASGASDPGGSGLSGHEYRTSTDGGSTWGSPVTGTLVNVSAEGHTVVQFRSLDQAGNASAWAPASPTAGSTAKVDRTAPSGLALSGGSSAWQSVADVTVSASGASDSGSGLAGYQYRLSADSGGSWSAPSAGTSALVAAEGETFVQFRVLDVAGNATPWTPGFANSSSIVRIDRTGPVAPTATGGWDQWQNAGFVTVQRSGGSDPLSGLDHFERRYSTDNGSSWSSPDTGASLVVTAEGQTLVQFRGVDTAGNASAWGPAAPEAGNTVRLDRTSPTAPSVSGGSLSWQSAAQVAFTPTGATDGESGIGGYQYRTSTDGGSSWSPPASGNPGLVTAEGESIIQMRAVDAAGNPSTWAPSSSGPATTARIDRTGPTGIVVAGGSLTWVNAPSRTVSASGASDAVNGVAGYERRTSSDGGATWSAAAPASSVTVLVEGETLVQMRAVDGIGNGGPWTPAHSGSPSASGTVRLDRTDPAVPGGLSATSPTATAPALTWAAVGDAVSYKVLRDLVVVGTPGSAPFTDSGASGGLLEYRVVAVDRAGNESVASGGLTVNYMPGADLVPPDTTIDAAPPAVTAKAGPELRFSDDGTGAGFECRADGGAWAVCVSPFTAGPFTDGPHTVQVRAFDAAGNRDPTPASAAFTIDTSAPAAPAAPGGSLPALSWAPVPGAATYEVGLGGQVVATTPGTSANVTGLADTSAPGAPRGLTAKAAGGDLAVSWSAVEDEGTRHEVTVRAVDEAGNPSGWSPAKVVVVTSGVAGYRLRVDGGAATTVKGTDARVPAAAGKRHTVELVAVDAAGNASAPARIEVAPDGTSAPVGGSGGLTVSVPAFARPRAAVRVSASAPAAWTVGGASAGTGRVAALRFSKPGRYTVTAAAAGRTATAVVVVDGTAPTVKAAIRGGALTARASDRGGAGVAKVTAKVGGSWRTVKGRVTLPPGTRSVQVRVEDRAGNRATVTARA